MLMLWPLTAGTTPALRPRPRCSCSAPAAACTSRPSRCPCRTRCPQADLGVATTSSNTFLFRQIGGTAGRGPCSCPSPTPTAGGAIRTALRDGEFPPPRPSAARRGAASRGRAGLLRLASIRQPGPPLKQHRVPRTPEPSSSPSPSGRASPARWTSPSSSPQQSWQSPSSWAMLIRELPLRTTIARPRQPRPPKPVKQ